MRRRRHGSARWLVAFVLLALAALAVSAWSLVDDPGPRASPAQPLPAEPTATEPRAIEPAAAASPLAPPPTRLQIDSGGFALTLANVAADARLLEVVHGGARIEGTVQSGERLRVLPTGAPGPWTLALARGAPWSIEVGAGVERLRLDLAELALHELRVGAPAGGAEGTLPRSGRTDLTLGAGRSTLQFTRGSDIDARLALGSGALVIQVDPASRGRLELLPGPGPATLIVDAAVTVALALPPGEPPPLALEGTWWRHRGDDGVTWVRAPVATLPDQAELTVMLPAAGSAPLAVTYR